MACEKASAKMRSLVVEIGGPVQGSENRKSWLARVARTAGVSRRSISAAFYGEVRGEIHRAGIEAKLRAVIEGQEKAAHNELAELKARIAALERRFVATDADFYQPTVDAHRTLLRVVGGENSTE